MANPRGSTCIYRYMLRTREGLQGCHEKMGALQHQVGTWACKLFARSLVIVILSTTFHLQVGVTSSRGSDPLSLAFPYDVY